MATFTKVSSDAFEELQLNAGVLLSTFDPATPSEPQDSAIIAATTGGINVVCTPTYSDFAEDVDNVPINTKEFKHLDGWDCSMSFNSLKFNSANIVWGLGAATSTTTAAGTSTRGYTKIVPNAEVKSADFKDIWWVGDKADGGAVAVKLCNALSTGGLNIQSTKNGKGTSQVTLTGHVSINTLTTMPMEFYIIEPATT